MYCASAMLQDEIIDQDNIFFGIPPKITRKDQPVVEKPNWHRVTVGKDCWLGVSFHEEKNTLQGIMNGAENEKVSCVSNDMHQILASDFPSTNQDFYTNESDLLFSTENPSSTHRNELFPHLYQNMNLCQKSYISLHSKVLPMEQTQATENDQTSSEQPTSQSNVYKKSIDNAFPKKLRHVFPNLFSMNSVGACTSSPTVVTPAETKQKPTTTQYRKRRRSSSCSKQALPLQEEEEKEQSEFIPTAESMLKELVMDEGPLSPIDFPPPNKRQRCTNKKCEKKSNSEKNHEKFVEKKTNPSNNFPTKPKTSHYAKKTIRKNKHNKAKSLMKNNKEQVLTEKTQDSVKEEKIPSIRIAGLKERNYVLKTGNTEGMNVSSLSSQKKAKKLNLSKTSSYKPSKENNLADFKTPQLLIKEFDIWSAIENKSYKKRVTNSRLNIIRTEQK